VESFYGVEVRELLGTLDLPALAIHGQLDEINPVEGAREIAERPPEAELVVLDGAGHVPTLSRPQQVSQAIADFIERRL
jgi:pimeloyl-ACP methyl ester carboxylesterase